MTDAQDRRLSSSDIKRVLDALDASSWDEALITIGDVSIAVARNGGTLPTVATGGTNVVAPAVAAPTIPTPTDAPAPTAAAPAVNGAPAPTEGDTALTAGSETSPPVASGRVEVVRSPSVGIFWRSPEPGAKPYVEVGQRVEAGDTLCIVEVMKLMSHVESPVAGVVTEIHAGNAASIEHGAPLFTITLDQG
ncbi:biotin/lipoyl-containing protein [Microbispora sp. H10836]|uniref:acetyl-CoA carboxylase biotin carboxyl carrier protein n=1 Tax=Microbispora sp. H10836 TaxID=2729106 RepID=UPI0014739E8A|nr:biotin/lipoyl-containing protein [Microbispora sp. H10836]